MDERIRALYRRAFVAQSTQTLSRFPGQRVRTGDDPDEAVAEITITAGLSLLLRDTWDVIQRHTASWALVFGFATQLLAFLFGGFDLQFKVATALIIIFLISRALVHLTAGEFGLAFWRLLHFPLWMLLIAVGNLGDLVHAGGATSLRVLMMFFVTVWCLGGAFDSIMRLLGLGDRITTFKKGFKRLVRDLFAEEEDGI